MTHEDPRWVRAGAWLRRSGEGGIAVLGAPVRTGSITPGRYDLAPGAIRAALERFSTYNLDSGVDILSLPARDLGDLEVSESSPEAAFRPIRAAVEEAARMSKAVAILGGNNSVTRPGVHGLNLDRAGLITLDAHLDLRDLEAGLNNGNPVRALLADGLKGPRIVQIGIQSFANSRDYADVASEAGITVVTADSVREFGIGKVVHQALDRLTSSCDAIYVDLDLDVLDRAYAPATPGSRPGGLSPWEARTAARICGECSKVRAIDFVEIDPTKDIGDRTSLAAAACVLEFASGVALRRR